MVTPVQAGHLGCVYTQAYWKNHFDAWPVTTIDLGTVSYTKIELLYIFDQPVVGNGLVALAQQLIAAKLNAADGAFVPTGVATAIADADTLIDGLVVPPVGTGYLAPSATSTLTTVLDTYNKGEYPDGPPWCFAVQGACCTDGPGVPWGCSVVTQGDCAAGGGYYLGTDTTCVPADICEQMLVEMESMSATATANGVLVRWVTSLETDTIGFRVLRELSGDRGEKRESVVIDLMHAAGHGLTGASYEVLDSSPDAARARYYYVEDIDVYGGITRHGPIPVERTRRGGEPRRREAR